MSDRFSTLTRTGALRRITAVTFTSAFLTAWVAAYGPPDCILLDQGRQMDNSFFRAVMKMLGTRLREAGVTLNLERCTWFSDEVEYLGHIFRPGQLHVHNKNVDALKHASFPTTKTQLKSFLGM